MYELAGVTVQSGDSVYPKTYAAVPDGFCAAGRWGFRKQTLPGFESDPEGGRIAEPWGRLESRQS